MRDRRRLDGPDERYRGAPRRRRPVVDAHGELLRVDTLAAGGAETVGKARERVDVALLRGGEPAQQRRAFGGRTVEADRDADLGETDARGERGLDRAADLLAGDDADGYGRARGRRA
ncbi:hypothetical protein [Bradyrhizobium sp. USDA 4461]